MKILNHSPLGVQLFRNAEGDDRISAFVLCALTCSIGPEALTIAPAQLPLETDANQPHPHDAMLPKERAASVCATGFVYAAGGSATEALARLSVGERAHEVVAIGARVWRKSMLGSVATSPLPFQRIPMAWNRAFGGEVKRAWTTQKIDGETMIVPGHSSHFPANPEGMGFYLTADDAVEQPLPVLEDPAHRIEKVDDWPEPRCFAPYAMWGALRAQLVLKPDGKEIEKKDIPRITTRAVPLLTFDRIAPGTRITLAGMRPDGADLAFTVPEPPVALRVAIGPDLAHVEPTLDSVDIDAEAQTARFVYRAPFAYDLVKREQRRIDVEPTAALGALRRSA